MLTVDERVKLYDNQDECLLAISEGKRSPMIALVALPPWRAVMIARIACRAGVMSQEELDGLVTEARIAPDDAKSLRKIRTIYTEMISGDFWVACDCGWKHNFGRALTVSQEEKMKTVNNHTCKKET